jgi:two-component system sensor kinase FixL
MGSSSGRPEVKIEHDPARLLNRRYLLAVVVVVLLLLLNQILVQPPLLRLEIDAPVINVAGRQRMLSQQLAKAALSLERVSDDAGRARHRAELAEVLGRWSAAHEELRDGRSEGASTTRNSGPIRAEFEELDPSFLRLRNAARSLIGGREPEGAALAVILENEADFLRRMERIVGLYEAEARQRVGRLIWTGWGVAGLIVVALFGLGRLVLQPAARLIESQFVEVRRARETLEGRVRERTQELERSNEQLAREVRERSRAEARHRALLETFSHASRTNTLGEMASGLAHELNQPLGAIANYAEGCLVALESPRPNFGEVREALTKLLATTLRAGQILKGIRRFVTRHGLEYEDFDPNRIAEEAAGLLGDEAARLGIDVRTDLAPDLPCLRGDPVQIQQVLVNLVRNALESTAIAKPLDPSILVRTSRADPVGVEFSVSDFAEGIDADRLPCVFDAYFSTRAEGMGMGLAISRTIVEAHQGKLTVESEPGVETIFRFILPAADVGDDAGPNGLRGG